MANFFIFGNVRQNRAFTLVELLVVIAIIAMLAGFILPAINAARENGRRVQCINNQSQVALALINYDGAKGHFPPLRSDAGRTANGARSQNLTWITLLFPFIEQNAAWTLIDNDELYRPDTDIGSLATRHPIYDMVLPCFRCPSSGLTAGDNRINYVGNAGGQNARYGVSADQLQQDDVWFPNSNWNGYGLTADGKWCLTAEFHIPNLNPKMFTIFFDHHAMKQTEIDNGLVREHCVVNGEYISSHDGASKTILLSENLDAGHWIWERAVYDIDWDWTSPAGLDHRPTTTGQSFSLVTGERLYLEMEAIVGFCYPHDLRTDEHGNQYQVPNYVPLDTSGGQDTHWSPLWINEGTRANVESRHRKARPSSGHPGIVMAGMCDRSVRVLRDDMDKTIFVRLCRPASGALIDMKKLD